MFSICIPCNSYKLNWSQDHILLLSVQDTLIGLMHDLEEFILHFLNKTEYKQGKYIPADPPPSCISALRSSS